jgi:hypothetical protein
MKKIVIVFGLIAGVITSAWVLIYSSLGNPMEGEYGMYYGYASMILAFSLIFVAVKSFRDKHNGGIISFGKAFRIGLYITLIASTIYVVSWLINYFFFDPGFMDGYTDKMIAKMKAENATQAQIDKYATEMKSFMEMYKNPFFNAMITYMEILPVGLIVSLICATILRKKPAVA